MTEKEKALRFYEICVIEADTLRERETLISQRENEAFEAWTNLSKEREAANKAWFEAIEARDAAFDHWMRLCKQDKFASAPTSDTDTDNDN